MFGSARITYGIRAASVRSSSQDTPHQTFGRGQSPFTYTWLLVTTIVAAAIRSRRAGSFR